MNRKTLRLILTTAAAIVLSGVARPDAQGPREGITVHGRWVLEVRNSDGTLSERREFENALSGGANVLTHLLTQNRTMGSWSIRLLTQSNDHLNATFGGYVETGNLSTGWIFPPSEDLNLPSHLFPTLTVASADATSTVVPPGNQSATQIVLKGRAVAANPGAILQVGTHIYLCNRTTATSECSTWERPSLSFPSFTSTMVKNRNGVESPLPLEKDQSVDVKVTISFTSPSE